MAAELQSTSEGLTMVLTISNPEHRNALGPEIYAAGVEALNAAESSAEVRSVVIAGEGAIFSAGGNLQRLQANRQQPREIQARSIEGLHNWIEAIRTFPKPVINAVFVMAYSNIALSPDGGGSWSLSKALPRPLVNELLMCGERIGAERLHQLGLVNRITDPGHALQAALELAGRLNERAPNALASIKELVNEASGSSLSQQLAAERDHFVRNLHHANAGIGISAFLEKKTPRFE